MSPLAEAESLPPVVEPEPERALPLEAVEVDPYAPPASYDPLEPNAPPKPYDPLEPYELPEP